MLTSRQIAEWDAYSMLEPFGPRHEDWRAGMIASVIANPNRKKGARALQPEDFMLKEPKTAEEKRRDKSADKLRASLAHKVKRRGE